MKSIDVRVSFGKRVPLGRLQKIWQRLSSVYLRQQCLTRWIIVIVEVRHEQQILCTSTGQRLDPHKIDVRDGELLIVDFNSSVLVITRMTNISQFRDFDF
jgi:hypothetical protein